MKLLKNITRLLVLTSLSLSLIPLTTTKAASSAINVDTSAVSTNNLNIKLASNKAVVESDTTSPTTASSTTTKAATGTDSATSDVTVNVLSGILTLQAVPDFNFGSMMQGTTAKLKSNEVDGLKEADDTNKTYGYDGNNSGLLQIVDSRNNLVDMPGFSLTAQIGKLQTDDAATSLPAILTLGALPLVDGDNNNISTTSTDRKTMVGSTGSENGENAAYDTTVIDLQKGQYRAGLIQASFTTPDSASLEIPGTGNNSQQSAKKMNAIVTWTLNAKPTVTSN